MKRQKPLTAHVLFRVQVNILKKSLFVRSFLSLWSYQRHPSGYIKPIILLPFHPRFFRLPCVDFSLNMVAQVPFHRWGGEGVPLPVRQQLFDIGSGATSCVVCGQPGHGIHTCHNTQSAEGQALAAAWDKKWLLLLGQELIRYAMCPDDAEYRRLSAALQLKSPVDRAAVLAFQRQHAIQSTSPGYGGVFGRQLAKPANTSQSAQVPQPSAVLKSKPKPAPKQAPKPAPKQAPKAPAKISIVAAPAAVPQPVKHKRKRRNRRQRKAQQVASTQVYGLQTSEMEVDAAPSSLVPAAPSPPRSAIRTSASPRMQAVRTSRSTAITPPPPLPSSNEQTVPVSFPPAAFSHLVSSTCCWSATSTSGPAASFAGNSFSVDSRGQQ